MDEEIKRGLKRIARKTETKMVESLLRWRYKKEGKKIPHEQEIQQQSRMVTDQANQIISSRGKNIWNELKKAYRDGKEREEKKD